MKPEEFASLVTDPYNLRVLKAITWKAKSAQEISAEDHDIPIASCYRALRRLTDAGLADVTEKVLTSKGKRMSIYKSCVRSYVIDWERGKLLARVQFVNGSTQTLGEAP